MARETPPPPGLSPAEAAEWSDLEAAAGKVKATVYGWATVRDLLAAPHSARSERIVYRLPPGARRGLAALIGDVQRLGRPAGTPTRTDLEAVVAPIARRYGLPGIAVAPLAKALGDALGLPPGPLSATQADVPAAPVPETAPDGLGRAEAAGGGDGASG